MTIKTMRTCGNDKFQLKIATNLRIATESLSFRVNEKWKKLLLRALRLMPLPARRRRDREPNCDASRLACHYVEAAERRRTSLPAWQENGDRRIALDAAKTKKGNNSELRSSLPINTREFLRAVRVSRHSLYAQALDRCSYLGSKARTTATRFPPDKNGKTILNGACS